MAHFTIFLSDGINAEVSKGKVFKKSMGFLKRWPFIQSRGEEKAGYIIKLDNGKEYLLIKANTGQWQGMAEGEISPATKKEGKWVGTEDTGIITAIKNAISNYENKQ
jgi:hypothetical protein